MLLLMDIKKIDFCSLVGERTFFDEIIEKDAILQILIDID